MKKYRYFFKYIIVLINVVGTGFQSFKINETGKFGTFKKNT